jgi:hypothetical protein
MIVLDYTSILTTADGQWGPAAGIDEEKPFYVSSSAEELARGYFGAFDALLPDFLYGPRFRPVMGNQLRH